MSKIAGIKNRSPETYPDGTPGPTVLQTLRNVNAGPAPIANAFSVIVAPPAFTPDVSANAVVMVSGVLQSALPAAEAVNVAIFVDGSPVYTIQAEAQPGTGEPTPFSLTFEEGGLTAHAPVTINVQAQTVTSGATAAAVEVSVVVIVTSD